jgi:hypothetical protein
MNMPESGKQSFKTCRYNFDPIGKSTGCTNPEIIALGIYTVINVSEGIQEDLGLASQYAELFERKLFYKYPNAIEKIAELALRELNTHSSRNLTNSLLELRDSQSNAKIDESEVIERALAGCAHCKHYKPLP